MVLDLTMPGMNGFDVLAALRAQPGFERLPGFVWTSQSLSPDDLQRLQRSAQAVIGKGAGGLDAMIENLRQWQRHRASANPVPN